MVSQGGIDEGGMGEEGMCSPHTPTCTLAHVHPHDQYQGRIQDFGKGGGSAKYIHNWGRVREGACPPPVTARGFWGSADSSPSGVWGKAPAAFLLLRLFSMKFTVKSREERRPCFLVSRVLLQVVNNLLQIGNIL